MLQSRSRSWMEIDLGRISHNVKEIHKLIPEKTKIMGIIKANGYGHGDVEVGKELVNCGVDLLAVSSVDEALKLREGGISVDILVLGFTPLEHFHYLIEENITQTVFSPAFKQSLSDYALANDCSFNVHIKVDTGMSRLGFQAHEDNYHIDEVYDVFETPGLNVKGIFSHFSVADSYESDDLSFTDKQIELFDRVLNDLNEKGLDYGVTHISNSYGVVNYPDLPYDYVRPGLLLLGVTSDNAIPINTNPQFKSIMEWKANVSMVKVVEAGASISYGRNFKTTKETKVASLSVGYADGYPRIASNTGMQVLVQGKRCNILGNICMDQMLIDVSDIDDVKQGDEVILIGKDDLLVDELTRHAQTINNETFTSISKRVPRFYID